MKKRRLPLIALDRDGTLIVEGGYMKHPRQVRLLPGVPDALRRLKEAGYNVVVLTNQSGVGRGLITQAQMRRVLDRFKSELERRGIRLDGYQWCVHHPDADCDCRKPKLGMLKKAAKKLGCSWRGAISVGDRPSDVQVGQNAGGRGILVLTGYGKRWAKRKDTAQPNHVAPNFSKAVDWILEKRKDNR